MASCTGSVDEPGLPALLDHDAPRRLPPEPVLADDFGVPNVSTVLRHVEGQYFERTTAARTSPGQRAALGIGDEEFGQLSKSETHVVEDVHWGRRP